MIYKIIITTALYICLAITTAHADNKNTIQYDTNTDLITLDVKDVYLDDLLQQLAKQVKFKLVLDGEDIHRLVTISIRGDSKKVIQKIVKPNSVILSQASTSPYHVTNVILLPIGEKSRIENLQEKMPPPRPSGDIEKDLERQKHYERRIQRKLEGHGRRQDELFNDASGNKQQ